MEKSPWPLEHEVVRQIQLKTRCLPDQIVVLESACDATRDEALVLHKYLQSQPTATVTIVTSNYHTRRTRWVFQEVFGAQAKQLHFVSAPTDYYTLPTGGARKKVLSCICKKYEIRFLLALPWSRCLVMHGCSYAAARKFMLPANVGKSTT